MTTVLRFLLVPGGGGSGPEHWHHRWADVLPNCTWVHQTDPSGGTRPEWVATLHHEITSSPEPVVLVAHSLACIAVAHWAQEHGGGEASPVVAALLVAPADIDDDWAGPDSLYKRFQPIPMARLPFASTVIASSNDPLLGLTRARELASAWGSDLAEIGDHLHVGSDADLGSWPAGSELLAALVHRAGYHPPGS